MTARHGNDENPGIAGVFVLRAPADAGTMRRMLTIQPGQRWSSTAEPELGLGTILRADNRQADIVFTGCGELKRFTHAASPLVRVRFGAGDRVTVDGRDWDVEAVEETDGMLRYRCGGEWRLEGALDPEQGALPIDVRLPLNAGDASHLFDLRSDALRAGQMDQSAFEQLALDLLAHFGGRFAPSTPHRFVLDTRELAIPEFADALPDSLPCRFPSEQAAGEDDSALLDAAHPLYAAARRAFLASGAGGASFMIDDSLPARSAVLQAVFGGVDGAVSLAIDAKFNRLAAYQPNAQSLYRARHAVIDMKPYRRSLDAIYPSLLQAARTAAAEQSAERLLALRLVVGSEFALFGGKTGR